MNAPQKIRQCREALEQLEREYQRKEYSKAENSAAFLKALSGEVERFIRLEHGTLRKKG